jgi:hypothetical protein
MPTRVKKPMHAEEAASFLIRLFARSGCVRTPNPLRRQRDTQTYKKGYELRFSVASPAELRLVQASLKALKLKRGEPYSTGSRLVQPVYGANAVGTFCRLIEDSRVAERELALVKFR